MGIVNNGMGGILVDRLDVGSDELSVEDQEN